MQLSDMTSPPSRAQANLFVFAAFCVGQAVQTNNGVIHPIALAWIGIGLIALVSGVTGVRIRWFSKLQSIPTATLLVAILALQWAQTMLWALRWGPAGSAPWVAASILLVAAGVGVIAFHGRRCGVGFALVLAGFTLAGVGVIHSSPEIGIDVFYFQDGASAALLEGRSPYEVRFRDIYYPQTGFYGADASVDGWLTYSYPYPPLMLLLVLPAKLLLDDVRYAHLAAMIASAVLLAATKRSRTMMLIATCMLLLPRNLLFLAVVLTHGLRRLLPPY